MQQDILKECCQSCNKKIAVDPVGRGFSNVWLPNLALITRQLIKGSKLNRGNALHG